MGRHNNTVRILSAVKNGVGTEEASGSIRIGFVAVPIFVAVVWHAAFKTNDVAGRGLFTMVTIEQGHPVEGLGPFADGNSENCMANVSVFPR